jgi:hypothetical protein
VVKRGSRESTSGSSGWSQGKKIYEGALTAAEGIGVHPSGSRPDTDTKPTMRLYEIDISEIRELSYAQCGSRGGKSC